MRCQDKVYHVNCFNCAQCCGPLRPGDKVCLINGGLFCEHEFPQLFSPYAKWSSLKMMNGESPPVTGVSEIMHSLIGGPDIPGAGAGGVGGTMNGTIRSPDHSLPAGALNGQTTASSAQQQPPPPLTVPYSTPFNPAEMIPAMGSQSLHHHATSPNHASFFPPSHMLPQDGVPGVAAGGCGPYMTTEYDQQPFPPPSGVDTGRSEKPLSKGNNSNQNGDRPPSRKKQKVRLTFAIRVFPHSLEQ